MRFLLRLAVPLVLLFGAFVESAAHAMLERAAPPVGSVVRAAPADIRLRFSEAIEPAFSRVTLTTAAGATVPTGPVGVDPGDDRQLVLALVSPLPAGVYRVTWWVVSRDTHTTEGDFTFEVAP